jgi:hypothetical protein
MKHLKHHAMHLLMCAPMLVIAIVFIARGGTVAGLIPVAGCVAMMWMMMSMMGGGQRGGGPDQG